MPSALRQLPVDFAELCVALLTPSVSARWYLDTQTGQVLLLGGDDRAAEQEALRRRVESEPRRYTHIPASEGPAQLEDMLAFARAHPDLRLRESLLLALSGLRPRKRFDAVLSWLPEQRRAWQRFRGDRVRERALLWLSSMGIQPA